MMTDLLSRLQMIQGLRNASQNVNDFSAWREDLSECNTAINAVVRFVSAPFGLGSKPPRRGYVLIPCRGEAHSNAFIDNCNACAPRWGYYPVKRSDL